MEILISESMIIEWNPRARLSFWRHDAVALRRRIAIFRGKTDASEGEP